MFRLLRLDNNPLIQPLPAPVADNDPVGADIADIPTVLRAQMKDWDDPVLVQKRGGGCNPM